MHLHPEWADEAVDPIIENCATKRQHLTHYTLDEQTALIACSKEMLELAGSGSINTFRSGNFAANRDTFEALHRNKIFLDASLNRCYEVSAPDLRVEHALNRTFVIHGVTTFPATVMTDGFGKSRPVQIGACSFGEMRDALLSAKSRGHRDFVIVSHNFEMLIPGTTRPDWIVVRRFERLCSFLAEHSDAFCVRGFDEDLKTPLDKDQRPPPQASALSTVHRYAEQIQRRLY